MNTERKNWRVVLAAVVVGMSTVGCAPVAFGQEKRGGEKTTFEIRPTETLKTHGLLWPPTSTVTPSATATRIPTPTETFTPTSTSTPTATQTETALPTNTATLTVLPTVKPLPSLAVVQKETERKIKYPITHGDISRKETALAIDDGWDKMAIEDTLKILKKYKIKATFFVDGYDLEKYPDLWRKAIEDGHEICNHSTTHTQDWQEGLSQQRTRDELLGWETIVIKVLGKEYLQKMKNNSPYFRIPYKAAFAEPKVLEEMLMVVEELGYVPIEWNAYGEGGNGSIQLLHFIKTDADQLERRINNWQNNGLRVVSVSELLRP